MDHRTGPHAPIVAPQLNRTPLTAITSHGRFQPGDRVTLLPGFRPGDIWRIESFHIYTPPDHLETPEGPHDHDPDTSLCQIPYASLRLLSRVGGVGFGTTRTSVPADRLRHVGGRRAAGGTCGRRLATGECPDHPAPAPAPDMIDADVFRSVLAGWVETAKENHEALDHRDEMRPCWETWHVSDFRGMIDDAIRETRERAGQRSEVGAAGCGCPITTVLRANGSDVDGTERVEHRAGCRA
jgi:hypothetical protein